MNKQLEDKIKNMIGENGADLAAEIIKQQFQDELREMSKEAMQKIVYSMKEKNDFEVFMKAVTEVVYFSFKKGMEEALAKITVVTMPVEAKKDLTEKDKVLN